MSGRPAIWREIVDAHRSGDIDLTQMSLSHVAREFECSTHTAGYARRHLGIKLEARPFYRPFQRDELWNQERSRLLEGWK